MTLHVLHEGLPLCGFTRKVPRDWPEGHVWVPKSRWLPDEKSQGVFCEDCDTVLMGRPLPARWDMQEQQYRDMMTTAARNLLERLQERGLNDMILIVEELKQLMDLLLKHIEKKKEGNVREDAGASSQGT